jgi:thiosulfate/3-mercaptopyruvate sulfurtransferase
MAQHSSCWHLLPSTIGMFMRPHLLTCIAGLAAVVGPFPPRVATAASNAQASHPQAADSILVSTDWLARHVNDPSVVVVEVVHAMGMTEDHGGRIPGTRALDYMDITTTRDGLGTELPDVAHLRDVFEKLGVSNATRVVLYSQDLPMAARALFTLDYLGHGRTSVLDGGLEKWRAEGRALSKDQPVVARGHLEPHPRPDVVATAPWIMDHLGKRGISLIDTRTDGEYVGAGERHGMPSEGHIAGAHQLQWEQLLRDSTRPSFLDRDGLASLYAARVQPGDTVVTYCFVGYRASMTYLAARYLGYPVKLYDGSYQDWSRRGLPLTRGNTP